MTKQIKVKIIFRQLSWHGSRQDSCLCFQKFAVCRQQYIYMISQKALEFNHVILENRSSSQHDCIQTALHDRLPASRSLTLDHLPTLGMTTSLASLCQLAFWDLAHDGCQSSRHDCTSCQLPGRKTVTASTSLRMQPGQPASRQHLAASPDAKPRLYKGLLGSFHGLVPSLQPGMPQGEPRLGTRALYTWHFPGPEGPVKVVNIVSVKVVSAVVQSIESACLLHKILECHQSFCMLAYDRAC